MSENPFLQLAINRLEKTLHRLERAIWIPESSLDVDTSACLVRSVDYEEALTLPMSPLVAPDRWGRLYEFRWFRVRLPKDVPPDVFLEWRAQGQSTAWHSGRPWFGFDCNHRYMRVPAGSSEIWLESACLPAFVAPPQRFSDDGALWEGAALVHRDEIAWKACHRLSVLFELAMEERMDLHPGMGRTTKPFGHQPEVRLATPIYRRLLRHLDRCGNAYDLDGAEGLSEALDEAYADLHAGTGFRLKAILSGHAHIDLVWLWPERLGRFKARHSFANALRLMDDYPEFRFQYSQTASYSAVGNAAPQLLDEVRERIRQGKWEASGALEVESDTLLPCGEALARSFEVGQRKFKSLTGSPSRLLWLPDVFGYSGCLPQLMRAFQVDYFFTTKLSWNAIHPFPYSSFCWRGDDGSEVLAHLTQEVGYNNAMRISEVRSAERSYRQSDIHGEFLLPTGFGDGGGGPTAEMCERARNAAQLAGLPDTEWDLPIRFFERLASCRKDLPTYQGELYFENHRGTYTAHGRIKLAMRLAERALQMLEAVHAAFGLGCIPEHLWESVIFAQFHDFIPGSSVPPVYLEGEAHLAQVSAEAHSLALAALTTTAGVACRFNPLPIPLRVYLPGSRILEIPPLSGRPESEARTAVEMPESEVPLQLSNSRLQAAFTAEGEIATMTVDAMPVRLSAGAGALWIFRDMPALHESWDVDRQALDTGRKVDSKVEHKQGRADDGTAWLRFCRTLGRGSSIEVTFSLAPESSILYVDIDLDWTEEYSLLKLAFPTQYRGRMARFGGPFGSTLRSQFAGDSVAEAMWEVPASRYAIVLDDAGTEGLFLLSEAKYGFSCRDGCLSVSLVRSPLHTGMDGEDYEFMYPRALRTEPEVARYTDQGSHQIRLALGMFHPKADINDQPAALAESAFTHSLEYCGAPVDCGLVATMGESLVPCWAQPREGGDWILRLHEVLGRSGTAEIHPARGWQVMRCRFDGSCVEPLEGTKVAFRAYEIVSLRIQNGLKNEVPVALE